MIPRHRFADGYSISRIIKGGWHLAGGHGPVDPDRAIADMADFVEAGITTFDCADIYTGVETLIGDFRARHPALAASLQVHTKFVPDLPELAVLGARGVETVIDRSLSRLRMERLDLVQFHWWDFSVPRYVEVALELDRLRRAGKIAHIGATNFDTAHLGEIVDAGVPVMAHQVQFSLLDDRPANGMIEFCRARGIALLCYGTVAGGFLSEAWLNREPPDGPVANRSLVKYRLIIEEFGGWALFQELLAALKRIADRHGCDMATVASRAMLDHPQVGAVIVGATSAAHLPAHRRVAALRLDAADRAAIDAVTRRRHGPGGDVYELERDRDGPHGRIMKYALNAGEPGKRG
ncbi:MAG: aldo/keto reductase [Gammaproteobacteria bacterium]|nr:aldo/keto reductase [Gammaproteobacteria bacterium]MDE2348281.1 aldo/keto reductase [Gammaproteobacteria bacterium]